MNVGKMLHSDLAQRLITLGQLVPATSVAASLIKETINLTQGGVTQAPGQPNLVGGSVVDHNTQVLQEAVAVAMSLKHPVTVMSDRVPLHYLSQHFALGEATASQAAARLHLDNQPNESELAHMVQAAEHMEVVRHLLGDRPIHISSWFRCAPVNVAVGGAANSAHMSGWAIDFRCDSFGNPLAVALALRDSKLRFDQLIHEFESWVHVSFDPKMRRECLTIDSHGTRSGLY